MRKLKELYEVINAAAPFDNVVDYDNVGILVGEPEQLVHRAMLALDITREVILEAVSKNADVIISHHPIIYKPVKRLRTQDPVYLLVQHGIAAICCHTNLDLAPEVGVNIALANRLGLTQVTGELPYGSGCLLYCGELQDALSPQDFADKVKRDLQVSALFLHRGSIPIKKVCLCSGAGGEYVKEALEMGADAFLTGEMKHHEMLEAAQLPITTVAAGHYATEKPFAETLLPYLRKHLPEVGFVRAANEKEPFEIQ